MQDALVDDLNLENLSRKELEDYLKALREQEVRQLREKFKAPGGLLEFVRYFWPILEPKEPLIEGWPLEAICSHLEAVTEGKILRLLINVPPGFMKSLLTNVFWPAWEWATGRPETRYVTFSYAASLTIRDNGRFRDLILSPQYQELYARDFKARKIGEEKVTNNKTGWKLASSVGGVGTGERGDRIIIDDPHNVKESESDVVREETVRWFRESLTNRTNNRKSAFVVIMQRVHEADVSGTIKKHFPEYTVLTIQMEFDQKVKVESPIGWKDPRTEDFQLAWEARFNEEDVARLKRSLGEYAYAGQYQQTPEVRGGGIIKRAYWQTWTEKRFPPFEYLLASLDTAYTEKHDNDPSAMTIWGVFSEVDEVKRNGTLYRIRVPKVMLCFAWEGWVQLHELVTQVNWLCSPKWKPDGDVPDSLKKLPRFPINKLIIEGKASGISTGQELYRLFGHLGAYSIEIIDPKKLGGGDKVARMNSIEHIFEHKTVYAPKTKYAERVIDQIAKFPRAEHDDLADTTSQALRYMRLTGLIHRQEEKAKDYVEQATFQKELPPLYG